MQAFYDSLRRTGVTYHAMIVDRLASPTGALAQVTQTLLRLTMAATPEADLFALVNSCNPLKPAAAAPSGSAVYNVFFKWTVGQLQRELEQQKEDADLIQAFERSLTFQEESQQASIPSPLFVTLQPEELWQNALRQVSDNNPHLDLSHLNQGKPKHKLMTTFLERGPYSPLTAKELTDELAMHILINVLS